MVTFWEIATLMFSFNIFYLSSFLVILHFSVYGIRLVLTVLTLDHGSCFNY